MKRATIEDVAKAAGVSRQTVSRAINDKGEISPETKQRVLEVVRQLGYRPNRLAQGMVTQRTKTVGLVMPDISNLFFPEVARGVQDAGREYDYNVLVCNTDDDPREEMNTLYSLMGQWVDGIVMISSSADITELQAFCDTFGPVVILNRDVKHTHVSSIMVENVRGGFLATEHLINLGRNRIGMLVSKAYKNSRIRRVQGYREALQEYGIGMNDQLIVGSEPTLQGGYEAMRKLLDRDEQISAVFAYNDLMGLGAIRACRDLGKNVPADIAIIGFDDIALAAMTTPSLSSIRVDKYAIGQKAMVRLLEMLAHPETTFDKIYIDVELVSRESTVG
ncbi:MAG: LacI family DNA-binding transcriptional regulator [Candidatus Promineifilaceae bacterium]|nr:LacI family DNA-binding transcriptional regulator [Candidatus Promineifilaceae bacterium]